jgi:hypothetical protein
MSRRYADAETYENREYYRNGRLEERDIEERDYYGRPGRTPDYLRPDYGRTDAGPLVLRERVTEDYVRPREREIVRERSPARDVVRERDIEIRTKRPQREREVVRVERRRESPPEIIREPTIHQEIVTHHRHVDHGKLMQHGKAREDAMNEKKTSRANLSQVSSMHRHGREHGM